MSDSQNSKESKLPDKEAERNGVQAPKSYYYDDSTGYETYDAEDDIDDEDSCEGESHRTKSRREAYPFRSPS